MKRRLLAGLLSLVLVLSLLPVSVLAAEAEPESTEAAGVDEISTQALKASIGKHKVTVKYTYEDGTSTGEDTKGTTTTAGTYSQNVKKTDYESKIGKVEGKAERLREKRNTRLSVMN